MTFSPHQPCTGSQSPTIRSFCLTLDVDKNLSYKEGIVTGTIVAGRQMAGSETDLYESSSSLTRQGKISIDALGLPLLAFVLDNDLCSSATRGPRMLSWDSYMLLRK